MRYKLNLANCDYFSKFDIKNNLEIYQFLEESKIDKFTIVQIPGDASTRRYYRLITQDKAYILMDSSDDILSVIKFCNICDLLRGHNYSAPEIYFRDTERGFLLLEDFGDNQCTKYLQKLPREEKRIYEDCIDFLTDLHKVKIPANINEYSVEKLQSELDIFKEWYLKYNLPEANQSELITHFDQLTKPVVSRISSSNNVLVLKDYMADNIMILNDRTGINRVGLLDFQDAVRGSKYYDLSSILQDARRDVSENLEKYCIERFIAATSVKDKDAFILNYNVTALHKNLRIIGVFHRLNLQYGKTKYLKFLPRMWAYVKRNLETEELQPLKQWFENNGLPKTV